MRKLLIIVSFLASGFAQASEGDPRCIGLSLANGKVTHIVYFDRKFPNDVEAISVKYFGENGTSEAAWSHLKQEVKVTFKEDSFEEFQTKGSASVSFSYLNETGYTFQIVAEIPDGIRTHLGAASQYAGPMNLNINGKISHLKDALILQLDERSCLDKGYKQDVEDRLK